MLAVFCTYGLGLIPQAVQRISYGYVYMDIAIVFLQYLTPGVLASFKECGIQSSHNQVKTIQSAVLKGWWIL